MMLSRSSWVSGAAAAGSGIFVFALVVGLLDQILPTLPKVSLSLAGIPGILAAAGASYGAWRVVQMGLQSGFLELTFGPRWWRPCLPLIPPTTAASLGNPRGILALGRSAEEDPANPAPRSTRSLIQHRAADVKAEIQT
jgi:hypothetical protein